MAHLSAINASMYSDLTFVKNLEMEYSGAETIPGVASGTPTAADVIDAIDKDLFTSTSAIASICSTFFTGTGADAAAVAEDFNSNCQRIINVREFPAMGTPPNIVNVPVYGQKTSQQIQGQSDAPSLEIQINYVADEWDKTGESDPADMKLGDFVGDGKMYIFRFAMMASDPVTYDNAAIAAVNNTEYYFLAKLEAMQVTPQLTDANTCTLTLSLQSDFYGPITQNA